MNEQNSKVTQYLIPANVNTRFEFFEGFGWSEFKIVVIALLVGVFIYSVLGIPKKTIQVKNDEVITDTIQGVEGEYIDKKVEIVPKLARILAIVIPGAGSFMVVKRNPTTGMSLVTMIKSRNTFMKKQKRYMYRYNSGSEVKM